MGLGSTIDYATGGLLGGGGGGGGISTGSTLSKEQKKLMKPFMDWLQQYVGEGVEPYGPTEYPQEGEQWWVAPLSSLEQTGLEKVEQYATGEQNTMYQDALTQALAGMSPEASEEFYRTNIYPRQQRIFEETVLPTTREAFVGTGTYAGSPRMQAESQRAGEFSEFAGQQLADIIMGQREMALQAIPYGIQASQLQEQYPLRQAEAALQAGSLPRMLQQAEISARLEEWKRTRPEYSPMIDTILAALNMNTQYAMPESGGISDILSSLAGGAGMALPFLL